MDKQTAHALAAVRGQRSVDVEINGRPYFILVDNLPCTVEDIVAGCSTSDYLDWEAGELLVFDLAGKLLLPKDKSTWRGRQPLRFFRRPKKAKTVCGICGLTLHTWRSGWKHANGGGSGRKCCDKPTPVRLSR